MLCVICQIRAAMRCQIISFRDAFDHAISFLAGRYHSPLLSMLITPPPVCLLLCHAFSMPFISFAMLRRHDTLPRCYRHDCYAIFITAPIMAMLRH